MRDDRKKVSANFSDLKMKKNIPHPTSPLSNQTDEQGRLLCSDLGIHIDREGTWFYNGTPIRRKELVKLYSSALQKDKENRFWLITPAEKGEVSVEDAPFMAVELSIIGKGKNQSLIFRTNVDEYVQANLAHPLKINENCKTGEPSPYILVRNNLEAKLTRSVFYQLIDLGVEKVERENQTFGVWSNGTYFEIGKLI